jgi:hypothetical protein
LGFCFLFVRYAVSSRCWTSWSSQLFFALITLFAFLAHHTLICFWFLIVLSIFFARSHILWCCSQWRLLHAVFGSDRCCVSLVILLQLLFLGFWFFRLGRFSRNLRLV